MDAEQALDELYAAAPEDFVSERTRLAKALKDEGLAEDAQLLAKLKKPSVAAWALNQLARQNRRDVDLLLDAGHRLREAQAGVLGGAEQQAFDDARKAEREAVARLTREAETLLHERGGASAATLNQVGESLRAAAISPGGRELLARGRFTQPVQAHGFELVAELAAATPAARPDRKRSSELERRRQAKEAVREAKERLRAAEREARDARREADRLSAEASAAERRADDAEARVEAAATELEQAEEAVRKSGG